MAHHLLNQSGPFILMELRFDWVPLNDWVSNYQRKEELEYHGYYIVLLFFISRISKELLCTCDIM